MLMNNEAQVIAEPGTRTIEIKRTFAAPPAKVFEAWSKPEHLRHWWDPTGTPLAECEMDFREQGTFRWVNAGPGGAAHPFTGTYLEIVRPSKLVFRSGHTIGTLLFTAVNGRTDFHLIMECDTVEARDAMLTMQIDKGTVKTLQNLESYLRSLP